MNDSTLDDRLRLVQAMLGIGNIASALDHVHRLRSDCGDDPAILALRAKVMSAASHSQVFDHIYRMNAWGSGSGNGSAPEFTGQYRQFLSDFMRSRHVTSVVDAGCGDWQFSKLIDWSGVDYLGIDVSEVVLNNTRRFAAPGVRFEQRDARRPLPEADLLVMKEVLQHWSNADILAFLPNLRRFRFCLITNDYRASSVPTNIDIPPGGWRPLDLTAEPFLLKGAWVGKSPSSDLEKRILLIERK